MECCGSCKYSGGRKLGHDFEAGSGFCRVTVQFCTLKDTFVPLVDGVSCDRYDRHPRSAAAILKDVSKGANRVFCSRTFGVSEALYEEMMAAVGEDI